MTQNFSNQNLEIPEGFSGKLPTSRSLTMQAILPQPSVQTIEEKTTYITVANITIFKHFIQRNQQRNQ